MPSPASSLLSYLRVVTAAWRNDPRNDTELLVRFAQSQDEAAFAVLVWRHGPLVWRTCQHILGDTPDAEDAFQVAFLTLARRASRVAIKSPAGWLHRVARQTAMNVRSKSRRSQDLERRLRTLSHPESEGEDASRADLYAVLDEELADLPERLRVPLVLRYLESKTQDEVARILGCSRSVALRRLARGEALLRERLERRGMVVDVGSVAVLLASSVTVSAVSPRLIGSTARAALRSLAFPPSLELSTSAALAERVMKTMLATKVKLVTVLLGLTLCLAGGGLLAYQTLAGNAAETPQDAEGARGEAEASNQLGAAGRVDCYGDPLPAHALARMGTTRLWRREGWSLGKNALTFSPDGKTLATHTDDMTVCLWDAVTGKEIRRLTTKAVKGHIVSLGFSPNGKTLVTVNYDQMVCWWEVATGKFLRKQEYQGPKRDNVISHEEVAFLPDGQMLGFADFLKSVEQGRGIRGAYIWDVATGKEICQLSRSLKEGEGRDNAAFSPDGKMLATAGNEDKKDERGRQRTTISLWDIATGKKIRQLMQIDGRINKMAFSPDGKTLASAADNQKSCLWEVTTGKKIHLLEVEGGMDSSGPLAYSPDGKTLVVGRAGHLFNVGTGKEIRSLGCEDENAVVALFSPDGKTLAMGDMEGAIRLWEAATGKEIGPRKGYRGLVRSVAYHPDGKILASMGGDETVRLWEVATGKEIRPLAKHTGWGSGWIAYSPDGKMLVSMGPGPHLWDTATGKEIWKFNEKRSAAPQSAAFSPDGKKLALSLTEGDQELVRLWEVGTGKEIYTLVTKMQRQTTPWSIAFSSDGRMLAAPGKGNTVSLWDVTTGKRIGQLGRPKKPAQRENDYVKYLAFSPDSRMLATSSTRDEKICVWEVHSGREIWQLDSWQVNNGRKVCPDGYTLAFSPDSRMLATAAPGVQEVVVKNVGSTFIDPKVHLWEMASGKEIGQLTGHQSFVQTLAFSPDGKTLVSGSDDLTCLIWDVTPFVSRLKPVPARTLPPRTLSQEQLETTWADLAKDPAKAYAAMWTLGAAPTQAIALLRTRLRPVAPVADPQQLQRWIADLDDNNFTVRDKARREIEKLGEAAIPALRQALRGQPALEVKRRLQDLLAELEPKDIISASAHHRLRELRAVQVLESIGTAEARQLLQAWAKGVAEASLTQEAQAALARLAKRPGARP